MLSVRVKTSMTGANGGVILASTGGITEAETWGRRAMWCDYSGPLGGGWAGITVMDYPANPRHST